MARTQMISLQKQGALPARLPFVEKDRAAYAPIRIVSRIALDAAVKPITAHRKYFGKAYT